MQIITSTLDCSVDGCKEADVEIINTLFDTTEFELSWLNQTSSAARVVIDGEDLSRRCNSCTL